MIKLVYLSDLASVMKGYLKLFVTAEGQWKKRYFVLQKAALCYYKSPDSSRPHGNISVGDMVDVVATDEGDGSPANAFCLVR